MCPVGYAVPHCRLCLLRLLSVLCLGFSVIVTFTGYLDAQVIENTMLVSFDIKFIRQDG